MKKRNTVTIPTELVLPIWVDFTYYFVEAPKNKETFNDDVGMEMLTCFCNNSGKANFAILVKAVRKALPNESYENIRKTLIVYIYRGWKDFVKQQNSLVQTLA